MSTVDCFDVVHERLDDPFVFSCSGDRDTVGHTVLHHGLAAYEAPVTSILIELARTFPGIVLDVGANTGLYTLAAAAAHRGSRVIAFEPLEPVRELLQKNVDLNPALLSRITIEPVGLSSERGSVTFYETINDCGFVSTSSSLERDHAHQASNDCVERTIETITLDQFGEVLGNQPISFIKIDVEGHEHAVITGGRRFLAKHRPICTVEILNGANVQSIDRFMMEADYMMFAMAPGVLRQSERARFFGDAWNQLLIPTEKLSHVFAICRRLDLRIELD